MRAEDGAVGVLTRARLAQVLAALRTKARHLHRLVVIAAHVTRQLVAHNVDLVEDVLYLTDLEVGGQ